MILKPVIRISRGGFVAAGLFLLLFVAAFSGIFVVASKNPADSGESALLLLLFALPWINIIPQSMVGPLVGIACVFLNALILYLVFGGLRITRQQQ